ncbi:hypothetical protein RI367_001650 [Sorochytrium milnesiophthora]
MSVSNAVGIAAQHVYEALLQKFPHCACHVITASSVRCCNEACTTDSDSQAGQVSSANHDDTINHNDADDDDHIAGARQPQSDTNDDAHGADDQEQERALRCEILLLDAIRCERNRGWLNQKSLSPANAHDKVDFDAALGHIDYAIASARRHHKQSTRMQLLAISALVAALSSLAPPDLTPEQVSLVNDRIRSLILQPPSDTCYAPGFTRPPHDDEPSPFMISNYLSQFLTPSVPSSVDICLQLLDRFTSGLPHSTDPHVPALLARLLFLSRNRITFDQYSALFEVLVDKFTVVNGACSAFCGVFITVTMSTLRTRPDGQQRQHFLLFDWLLRLCVLDNKFLTSIREPIDRMQDVHGDIARNQRMLALLVSALLARRPYHAAHSWLSDVPSILGLLTAVRDTLAVQSQYTEALQGDLLQLLSELYQAMGESFNADFSSQHLTSADARLLISEQWLQVLSALASTVTECVRATWSSAAALRQCLHMLYSCLQVLCGLGVEEKTSVRETVDSAMRAVTTLQQSCSSRQLRRISAAMLEDLAARMTAPSQQQEDTAEPISRGASAGPQDKLKARPLTPVFAMLDPEPTPAAFEPVKISLPTSLENVFALHALCEEIPGDFFILYDPACLPAPTADDWTNITTDQDPAATVAWYKTHVQRVWPGDLSGVAAVEGGQHSRSAAVSWPIEVSYKEFDKSDAAVVLDEMLKDDAIVCPDIHLLIPPFPLEQFGVLSDDYKPYTDRLFAAVGFPSDFNRNTTVHQSEVSSDEDADPVAFFAEGFVEENEMGEDLDSLEIVDDQEWIEQVRSDPEVVDDGRIGGSTQAQDSPRTVMDELDPPQPMSLSNGGASFPEWFDDDEDGDS